MLRGILVSAIYRKVTQANVSNDAAPVTLMSTDVERIVQGFCKIHEIWSNLLQIVSSPR
jgi:ATP-binding cassette subfamily C (CFTR/MRP) protein 1